MTDEEKKLQSVSTRGKDEEGKLPKKHPSRSLGSTVPNAVPGRREAVGGEPPRWGEPPVIKTTPQRM